MFRTCHSSRPRMDLNDYSGACPRYPKTMRFLGSRRAAGVWSNCVSACRNRTAMPGRSARHPKCDARGPSAFGCSGASGRSWPRHTLTTTAGGYTICRDIWPQTNLSMDQNHSHNVPRSRDQKYGKSVQLGAALES